MRKYFWCVCLSCADEWVSGFVGENGFLTPVDETGEACVDCGGEVDIQDEYESVSE